jgi:hypothetical protein
MSQVILTQDLNDELEAELEAELNAAEVSLSWSWLHASGSPPPPLLTTAAFPHAQEQQASQAPREEAGGPGAGDEVAAVAEGLVEPSKVRNPKTPAASRLSIACIVPEPSHHPPHRAGCCL